MHDCGSTDATRRPRKRRVTPETMAEAGIALTLPQVTVKSIAQQLGVSIVAIYNNIEGPDALRTLVAEEILHRWSPPIPQDGDSFHDSLLALCLALRALVNENPGIGRYLIEVDSKQNDALRMADALGTRYRVLYDLTAKQASWTILTVAEHALALAEMVYTPTPTTRVHNEEIAARTDLDTVQSAYDKVVREPNALFAWSMRTVIIGVEALIAEPDFEET